MSSKGTLLSMWFASALLLFSAGAQAAVTVNKAFSPGSMTVNGTSTVTITLGNTGGAASSATAFTDTLPSGLVIASPSNVSTTCGGTASATSGGNTVSLSGGTIPASGGSCTVTVTVTSSTIGNYTNTIPVGGVSSSQGSNGSAASSTLAVITAQPVTGSWVLTSYNGGGGRLKGNGPPITYTVTLNNSNTLGLTSVGTTFSLQQPYLAFATPSNLSTTCGGTVTLNTGAGTGTLSGGTIPANGSCTITFNIIAAQPNNYLYNSVLISIPANNVTDAEGITNTAAINTSIGVQTGALVSKAFSPGTIISGGTSTLTLTIQYFNAANALSPINLTDVLPAGMTVASTPNASTNCGGTLTATAGSGSVQLSGGSEPAVPATSGLYSTCTITLNVTGINSGTSCTSPNVTLTNAIPAGNFGGVNYPAASTNLIVTPAQALCGSSKSISFFPYFPYRLVIAGSINTVTVTLDNPLSTPDTVTLLTDNLTTMGAGYTVAASPAPTTTCASGVVTALVGATSFTMVGGVIPASNGSTPGSCTVTVAVHIPLSAANVGSTTDTIPVGAIVTSHGSNTVPLTHFVNVYTPLFISKVFNPAQGNPGVVSQLTISIANQSAQNNGTAVDPLTNISGSDPLPAGMAVATPSALSTTCTGTVTAPAGGSTVTFSGVNLNPNQSCTITLNVKVPPGTPPGNLNNVIPANSVTTDQGVTNSTVPIGGFAFKDGSAAATLVVTNANVTVNKTFTPTIVAVGTASQLAIQFINTNPGNITITQAALTDTLPTGMVVANPASASFSGSGCAGTVTATPGASTVSLSGAQINASTTCTVKVNVVANAAGNLINTIPANVLSSTQVVTNASPTTATLGASGTADLAITKTDGKATVANGTTTTYTIVVSNAGPNNVIGASVADTPPSGVTFASWTCAASAGASCGTASGSGAINDTININVGATVTYTVQVPVPFSYSGGLLTNTATVTQPALVTDPNTANNTATDTDTVVPGVVLALTKTDNSTTYTPGATGTYTITAKNTGPANATQVNIADSLPAGVTLNGVVTCTASGTATCGTVTGAVGQTQFTANSATLPANSGGTLTFSVPVKFAANMITATLTNTVAATDVPSGATGSASDGDDFIAPKADVSVVKAGPASVVPGAPISYTLTISNAGPSDANNTTFNDAVPAAITGVTASCGSITGGAVCPGAVTVAGNAVSGAIPTLPANSSVTITINGTASASNGTALSNTATVSSPNGVTDSNTANNTSTVTTAITPILHITKTTPSTTVIPGGTVTYTITLSNPGPAVANNVAVSDPIPAGITGQTWTCAGSGGATCTASGSGALSDTIATMPPGSSAVYTVTATISSTPPTNVSNTATATVPNNAAVCAPANTPAPCSATASVPPVPQVGITKTADVTKVTAGGTIVYTITVSNTGVLSADNTPVSDPIPTGIVSQTWTCTPSGGATCGAASGSGALSDTIGTFPTGSFVKYIVTAIVSGTPPASITNTATATPTGSTLCTPGNTAPPCSATATVSANPQITITKTASTSSLVPGGTVTYTVTVTNNGSVAADGTTVSDAIPTGIASQTWTCAPTGATCAASGTGAISDTIATFPPGGKAVYTVTATLAANPPATVANTADATPPTGGTCGPNATTPPCQASVTGNTVPRVQIAKSADVTTVSPNGTVHYTITVTNAGAAAADGTTVSDPVPTGIASQTWACVASGGATCTASGTGTVTDTITAFPSGSSVTYTVTATANANPPATVSNTASTNPSNNGVCAPNNTAAPCTATVNLGSVPLISVTKSVDKSVVIPGDTIHYTVVVSNTGSASADGTTVSDPIPAGIASQTWTCAASGGAACAPSGTGAISDTLTTFPAGTSVTYAVTAAVVATPPASISNTATAMPPVGGLCTPGNTTPPCASTVTSGSAPRIGITKTADVTTATPNGTVHYTVTVSNTGSVAADGTTVSDPIPTGIASQTWACVANGGATCAASGTGAVSDTLVTFPAGSSVVYTVTAIANANPPATVSNTASATPPSGVCTPNNSAPPCTATVNLSSVPQVSVTKTANTTTLTPNGQIVYTIVGINTGSVSAAGTTVSDPAPTGIASQTWTCSATGGAVCPNANGTGDVNETLATFPAGSAVTYTVTATVIATPPATVTNTATVTPPSGGLCTPNNTPPPCTSSATTPPVSQVSIRKTTVATAATPNGQIVYTIMASNTGSVSAAGTVVSDPIPAGIASQTWICSATGGAICPNAAGTGALNETLATFPAGSTVTYTVTATVSATPPAQVTNTATATPPGGGLCAPNNTSPPCTSAVTVPASPQVSVTKTANTTTLTPNGQIVYTIVASNTGSVSAAGTTVSDPAPTGIASQTWTCSATGGAVCPNASGTGDVNETLATFPAGSAVTYTVTATVVATPPATVINTATVMPPSGGLCTPNNTPPPCTSSVPVPPVPQVSITKTANTTTLTPNGQIVYTIVTSNTGSVSAAGTVVSDPAPTGIASQTWACSATGGAVCPNASGSGDLSQTLATFPAGSSVTYTVTATVIASPPATVTNTATATPPSGGLCMPNNTAPPCTATVTLGSVPLVSVTKTANTTTLIPGGTIVYTVTVANTGTVPASNTQVSDPIASGLTAYSTTCAATSGAVCPNGAGPNTGALNETIATLPVGGRVVYTITATVSAVPAGAVTNAVSVTPPQGGLCTPGNTPPPCTGTTTSSPPNAFDPPFITKAATVVDAQTLLWTIVADNNQNLAAQNLEIRDPMPANMTFVSGALTCTAFGSTTISQCTFDAANNRIVVDALMQSDVGATNAASGPNRLSIVFQARFVNGPVAVTNIASACWDPQNDMTNVSACAQAVQGSAQYTPVPATPPVPAPVDARWMLWLMAMLLAYQAGRRLCQRR